MRPACGTCMPPWTGPWPQPQPRAPQTWVSAPHAFSRSPLLSLGEPQILAAQPCTLQPSQVSKSMHLGLPSPFRRRWMLTAVAMAPFLHRMWLRPSPRALAIAAAGVNACAVLFQLHSPASAVLRVIVPALASIALPATMPGAISAHAAKVCSHAWETAAASPLSRASVQRASKHAALGCRLGRPRRP